MKKLLLFLILFLACSNVFADEYKQLPYKNIKDGKKITVTETAGWTNKVGRKDIAYVRNGSIFTNDSNGTFDTDCSYLFVKSGKLIGYSESDLKFYEFLYNGKSVNKQEIYYENVAQLFKDFRVILISEFSDTTNVYKFKKRSGEEKIMIINDTDQKFDNYGFTTNNSRFEKYNINNTICITRRGLIQFSTFGEDTKNSPWFILLVR